MITIFLVEDDTHGGGAGVLREAYARTIVLDQGQVVVDGRTVELLNDEKLMLTHGLERPHILRHQHPH